MATFVEGDPRKSCFGGMRETFGKQCYDFDPLLMEQPRGQKSCSLWNDVSTLVLSLCVPSAASALSIYYLQVI
jgi:hypothetical protein